MNTGGEKDDEKEDAEVENDTVKDDEKKDSNLEKQEDGKILNEGE